MRAFIVMCLVAVACADKLGYNYQPVGHSAGGLSFQPGSGIGSGLSGGSLGSSGLGGDSGLSGAGLSGAGLGGLVGSGLPSAGDAYDAPASTSYDTPEGTFEKEFFTFTANDDEFNDPEALRRVAGSLNRGLRVVFIKGPENRGLEDAALALAKQAAEQQTAIYVLNKQTDIGDLASKLNALRANKNNKPDVHFVKYRTPEDAANAQRAIQDQYNGLGGSTANHDGGVAPTLNFASRGPVRSAAPARQPDNSYLPSSIFRLRV